MVTVTKQIALEVFETWCGHWIALPAERIAKLRETGENFWCPYGHIAVYANNEVTRLRTELDAVKQDRLRAVEAAGKARRELDGALVEIGKLHKRVQGGVCPYCKRTFRQVQRHMANKHPERPGVVRDAEAQGKAT